jgi:hypothetical protein
MTTLNLLLIAFLAVVAGLVLFRVIPVVQTYFRYRGKRLITCPETLTTEAVDVAARKAAAWAFIGESELCTDKCSGWPERRDCGQECLQQIEADPENCLVWNIVSKWYEGQSCVYCHSRFEPFHYLDRALALMGPDRKTVKWEHFLPEQLPELFSTYKPVCWNCHLTQTCRRELQELVVDRKR